MAIFTPHKRVQPKLMGKSQENACWSRKVVISEYPTMPCEEAPTKFKQLPIIILQYCTSDHASMRAHMHMHISTDPPRKTCDWNPLAPVKEISLHTVHTSRTHFAKDASKQAMHAPPCTATGVAC